MTPTTDGPPESSSPDSPESSEVRFQRNPGDLVRNNAENSDRRALELKLMHHYTALTARTLSDSPSQQNAWAVDIPPMAYDCPHLMDALLAVSALHLRTLNPDDKVLLHASHSYMASALTSYSSKLKDVINEQNAEALFATAALIAFQAAASRRFEPDRSEAEDSPDVEEYTLPMAWFHSFQGVKTVVMASWMYLRNSSRVYPIIVGQPPLALNLDPGRHAFFSFLLEGMDEDIERLPKALQQETRRSYMHAVAFLDWAHRTPKRPHILGFAATVCRRFVELIGEQDPRALAIIACFFAMTKVVDDRWWLEGIARKEVMGIYSLLPQEWRCKMEWPMTIVSQQGQMNEEIWGVPLDDGDEGAVTPRLGEPVMITEHIDLLANLMTTAQAVD